MADDDSNRLDDYTDAVMTDTNDGDKNDVVVLDQNTTTAVNGSTDDNNHHQVDRTLPDESKEVDDYSDVGANDMNVNEDNDDAVILDQNATTNVEDSIDKCVPHQNDSTLPDDSKEVGARPRSRQRPVHILFAVLLTTIVIILGLIAAVIVLAIRNKQLQQQIDNTPAGDSTQMVQFVPELPESEIISNKQQMQAALYTRYKSLDLSWNAMAEPGTPQAMALEWVCGSVTYSKLHEGRRIQRYALGVFYYSTFQKQNDYYFQDSKTYYSTFQKQNDYYFPDSNTPSDIPGWTSATGWLTAENECDWEGIECQDNEAVTSILLREHHLSGTLPNELGFLNSLVELDLTSNFIYVNGEASMTPFRYLDQLETLEMGNNYVVTINAGLPVIFAYMTNLKKLVVSHNILQGPIDGSLVARFPQLTHLELESNFFTGDFPGELRASTSLIYLYIRRNLMNINLETLLGPGTLPKLFALWLDSNTIKGSIPASISNHTDLASLSITNATLTGSIPSELGDLTGLRRVRLYTNQLTGTIPDSLAQNTELEVLELYENKLTGTMPGGVCQTLQNSDYEFKALSADCEQVACQNCCMQCY